MVTRSGIQIICRLLKAVRALLMLAVCGAIVVVVTARREPSALPDGPLDPSPVKVTEATAHDLEWYAPLWQRDLKQPPVPTEEASPTDRSTEPNAPVPALLATFVDASESYAHLRDNTGRVQLKAVADTIDRYRVDSIQPGRVRLSDGTRTVWVQLPKSENK